MPRLYRADNQESIGEITTEQLHFLKNHLVDEDVDDRDYYINQETLEMLEEKGGDATLIALLRQTLGDNEDMDIVWSE